MLDYYTTAAAASKEIGDHYGLRRLAELAQGSQKILDVGCGEGTRLHTLAPKKIATGVDASSAAIKLAQKKYPKNTFVKADASKLPFPNAKFDLVYCAFVLEHTTDPEAVITEMLRVCQPGGKIVFLCPNFGAPNRRSPNSVESPLRKLIAGVVADIFTSASNLTWRHVTPKQNYSQIDDDTTVEPYLLSLVRFLKSKKIKICDASSLWSLEPASSSPRKQLFKILGQKKLYPFINWGPQLFIEAQK